MKYCALALIPLAATAVHAGDRDRGAGLPATVQGDTHIYDARGFDTVTLAGSSKVIIHTGGAFAVRAEGPADAFANFRIARNGRALEVGRRYEGRPSTPAGARLTVHITMPLLAGANVGGSGSIDADRAGGGQFVGAVGGSGSLHIERLNAREAALSVGGSGEITAAGAVETIKASIGGSGRVVAPGLRAAHAAVSIGGSGSVQAHVVGTADVSIAGSGDVDLGPQARCTVSKVGSGRVHCGG